MASAVIPLVQKKWLFAVAGYLWSVIGLFLIVRGMGWFEGNNRLSSFLFGIAGFAVGIVGYFSGFRKIAEQNVLRIHALAERSPITAFLAPRGYAMIVLMIALGFFLRQSPFPKTVLAPLYIAMGCALLLGSSQFHLQFLRYPSTSSDNTPP